MTEAQKVTQVARPLAERIEMAHRFRKQFCYTADEEFLMSIIEDLLKGERP